MKNLLKVWVLLVSLGAVCIPANAQLGSLIMKLKVNIQNTETMMTEQIKLRLN